ncbi:MAG: two-component regulator propeller domain-containing protein [Blastocatellia bacterium]
MKRYLVSPYILLVLLFCPALVFQAAADRLPVRVFSAADGLAYDYVTRMYQDSRGHLWFCTAAGLIRYDGYQFTTYGTEEGLGNPNITDILELEPGVYRVASFGGGLYQLETGAAPGKGAGNARLRFTPIPFGDTSGARTIYKLHLDRDRRFWVGTGDGLFQQTEKGFTRLALHLPARMNKPLVIRSFANAADGSLWIGHFYGLTRRAPDGRLSHYTMSPSDTGSDVARRLEPDREGRLWIAHEFGLIVLRPEPPGTPGDASPRQMRLRRGDARAPALSPANEPIQDLAPGTARMFLDNELPGASRIRSLCLTSDGKIWMGSLDESGLVEFDGRRFHRYTTADGLSDNRVTSILEDRNGNLWVGSFLSVMQIPSAGIVTYKTSDGLDTNAIVSLVESRAGGLCAISVKGTINRHAAGRFIPTRPNLPARLSGSDRQQMIEDHNGEWWIGTAEGLYRFPAVGAIEQLAAARPLAVYTTRDGLPNNPIVRLFEDSRGDIWIGSMKPGGNVGGADPSWLTRWERATGRFRNFGEPDGLSVSGIIWFLAEDTAGAIWAGYENHGVARYQNGRFTHFKPADGAPPGRISGIYTDLAGRLWMSSTTGGLVHVENATAPQPRFIPYNTASGLSSGNVQSLTGDTEGNLYAGTGRGIDRVDAVSNLTRAFPLDEDAATGNTSFALRDRQGDVWFATSRGLSRLVPGRRARAFPPRTLISRISAADGPLVVSELGESEIRDVTLPPGRAQIQIGFLGLSFAAGERLRYQYKFAGANAVWSAPAIEREVNLSLEPGAYMFLVRAISADGTVSPEPAVFSFRILRPVWQRWWFIALTLALITAAVYFGHRYHVARAIEIERVRIRIATDLHDDIGASLSRMAILSEVVKQQNGANPEQSHRMLTDIADSARGLVDSMSDIVWSIDPRRDELIHVIARARQFAADALDPRGIAWQFTAPAEIENTSLGPDQRRHLFLILKEAINNAARHAECRNMRISLALSGSRLIAEINDDGRGFALAAPGVASQIRSRGGNGLKNMQTRAASVGGDLHIESAPGQGTRLRLTLPVR